MEDAAQAAAAPRVYTVNEIFFSLQGEGARAGTANVFVRFSGCNLECDVEHGERSPGGFACDTEFVSGAPATGLEILAEAERLWPRPARGERWVIFTGGEPALQLDAALVASFQKAGWLCAIETNGTRFVGDLLLDWICVSPKVAEHAIAQRWAHEVKYVRGYGQGIPRTAVEAGLRFISPAFDGRVLRPETLAWCVELIEKNPDWRLTLQLHKLWGIR